MEQVDQIIIPRWLITMDGSVDQAVLEDHALAISGERIVALDSRAAITARYRAKTEVTLGEHALIPGLVNAHTHAAMTLLRGYADDLPLTEWLRDHIWPAEAAWVDARFVEIGTDLALAEMIRSGTTCFNDMYYFPEVAAARAENAGMRACIGMIVIDFPSTWAQNADECINKGLELRDSVRHSALITTAFAPHAPYSVSDQALEKVRVLADEMDCRIHLHVHETRWEIAESTSRYGMRPLERLDRLGLVGPRLAAVHMIQLLPGEIETVAERGVHVVHCPQSNLKLGSGLCPLAKLLESGVAVAIGTDGAASNNNLDMLAELQTASLLAKGVSENPSVLPAYTALEAATLGGARALGLDDITGSLCPGKRADMVAIDLSDSATQPVYHPLAQIVYSAARHQVSDVWVNGKRLLENRRLTTLDENEIVSKAAELAQRITDAR